MARPSAADMFRRSPHYSRDTFRSGLARCGYEVGQDPKEHPEPHDVLLIWNRAKSKEPYASRYESAGARVIVAENGYIGTDNSGHQYFAMALGHHLGAGDWKVGSADRWSPLNVELKPWHQGDEIVVLPQRGFGEPGVGMPMSWPADVVERLKRVTDRPVRVREHPGKQRPDPYDDLRTAWAAVTWASGAGIKAIVSGTPVFYEMPKWLGAPASHLGLDRLETPFLGDRLPMLRRLAWAQWSQAEIADGEPFRWLLG